MTKLNLESSCFFGEIDFLNENKPRVEKLILRNPFSKRMIHLLNHQELHDKLVPNLAGELEPSNCLGTVFWIAGVSKLDYPYQANENELDSHMHVEGDTWEDYFRVHNERKIKGAFCFSYSIESDSWHAGIYLGQIKSTDVLFAQHGSGQMFGVETSRCYANPKYYIPRTLKTTA